MVLALLENGRVGGCFSVKQHGEKDSCLAGGDKHQSGCICGIQVFRAGSLIGSSCRFASLSRMVKMSFNEETGLGRVREVGDIKLTPTEIRRINLT